jgi:2,4-dienoyl-CoA reductase-like NADH-dependent reductase (Old Yellow Enzyme family)
VAAELRHLFTPLALRGIELRNRILMTGATTNMAYGGLPGEQLADYYAERARGGAGLIVTEMTVVHPSGIVMDRAIQNWDDRVLSGFQLLAAGVHRHGGKVFAQVGHPGRQGRSFFSEQPLLAPSALPSPAHHEVPKEAELEDVSDLVRCYADGAARALEAGMDGVEIHSAYGGYFLAQWLSPTTNVRQDDYGGTLEQRLRIVLDVVDAVREAAGPDVPVGIQITGDEGVPGGLTPDDAVVIAASSTSTAAWTTSP